jgi:hypothetical protein
MTLRLVAALAVALRALASASAAQFEGSADLKVVSSQDGRKVEGTGKLYLTPTAWRIETSFEPTSASGPAKRDALGPAESYRIVVFGTIAEPRKSWILNERTRTYAVVVADSAEREGRAGDADEWMISRTGKDTVAGLACERVNAKRRGEEDTWEACLARDFLSSAWMRALGNDEYEGWVAAAQRAGVDGYPVRLISLDAAGNEKYRFELLKVERRRLAASLFEVPAGYRETSAFDALPQAPRQP